MIHLLRAEWLKLTRRPLAWVLLGTFLVSLLLFLTIEFLAVALHDGTFTGGSTRIQFLSEPMLNQFRADVTFPGIFGSVLGQVNSIGGICAIVLAAGALGNEYNWGTLRLHMARQPRRGRYLVAKTLVLLALLVVAIAIALAVGALLALLFGSILGDLGSVRTADLLNLPLGLLRALYVILPYMMITLAICVVGRSVFVGVAGGLVFLALDGGAATFAPVVMSLDIPFVTFVFNMVLQRNINTLIVLNRSAFGGDVGAVPLMAQFDVAALPAPWLAFLVIALYSSIFFGFAYYRLTRDDIGGAG